MLTGSLTLLLLLAVRLLSVVDYLLDAAVLLVLLLGVAVGVGVSVRWVATNA